MPPPQTADPDLTFFTSLPWCHSLLSDPSWSLFKYPSDTNTITSNRPGLPLNYLITRTFNTRSTMPHIISQVQTPAPKPRNGPNNPTNDNSVRLRMLISLGNDLQGWPNVAHGGAAATIHDQAMTTVVYLYRTAAAAADGQNGELSQVTAELTVKYTRAMVTPGVVVVEAWVRESVKGKYYAESEIRDEEGRVLSRGNAVFALMGRKRKGKAKI